MKVLSIAALLLTAVIAVGQTPAPIHTAAEAALHIAQQTVVASGECSGTAIGPHAILTASHCEEATDALAISGYEKVAHIDTRLRDGLDHTIYLVSGVTFKNYADVDLENKFYPGEDVYLFGNPGNWSFVFRKGYVAGILQEPADGLAALFGAKKPPQILFDFQAYYGDSGSGIYDAKTNKIIGVISEGHRQAKDDERPLTIQLIGSYPLVFKQADLDTARAYNPPAPAEATAETK